MKEQTKFNQLWTHLCSPGRGRKKEKKKEREKRQLGPTLFNHSDKHPRNASDSINLERAEHSTESLFNNISSPVRSMDTAQGGDRVGINHCTALLMQEAIGGRCSRFLDGCWRKVEEKPLFEKAVETKLLFFVLFSLSSFSFFFLLLCLWYEEGYLVIFFWVACERSWSTFRYLIYWRKKILHLFIFAASVYPRSLCVHYNEWFDKKLRKSSRF